MALEATPRSPSGVIFDIVSVVAFCAGWCALLAKLLGSVPALDAAVTCRLRMPPTCGEVSGGVAGQDAGRV